MTVFYDSVWYTLPESTRFTHCETAGYGNNSSIGVLEVFRYWQIITLAQIVFHLSYVDNCLNPDNFSTNNSLRTQNTLTTPPPPFTFHLYDLFLKKAHRMFGRSFFLNCIINYFFLIMSKLRLIFFQSTNCFFIK